MIVFFGFTTVPCILLSDCDFGTAIISCIFAKLLCFLGLLIVPCILLSDCDFWIY